MYRHKQNAFMFIIVVVSLLVIAPLCFATTGPLTANSWNNDVSYSVSQTFDNNRGIIASGFSATAKGRFYKGGTTSRDAVYTWIVGVDTTRLEVFSSWTGTNGKTIQGNGSGTTDTAEVRVHGILWVGTRSTINEAVAHQGSASKGQRWKGN